jgi:O-antigen/teichoic acid export membrane protein
VLKREYITEIACIGGISTITTVITILTDLLVRVIIVDKMGVDKIGIYIPIIAWSSFFSSFFLPGLFQYLFPRFGECKTNGEISKVVNDVFRLTTFVIFPATIIIISLRDILIPLFYSKDFMEAALYLPLHFIGIFFWTWLRAFRQIYIPTGRIKKLLPFALGEQFACLVVVYFLIDEIGLWSWTLRFSLVPFIFLIFYWIYFIYEINFKAKKSNLILMAYTVATSFLVYYISASTKIGYIFIIPILSITLLFLSKKEKEFIFNYLKRIWYKFVKNK